MRVISRLRAALRREDVFEIVALLIYLIVSAIIILTWFIP